jgi:hypothetical protein
MFARECVFTVHKSHVWAQHNSYGIRERGHYAHWFPIVGDIVLGPYLLPERLGAQQCPDFMETLPPRLLTARRILWSLHYGAPAHRGVAEGGGLLKRI